MLIYNYVSLRTAAAVSHVRMDETQRSGRSLYHFLLYTAYVYTALCVLYTALCTRARMIYAAKYMCARRLYTALCIQARTLYAALYNYITCDGVPPYAQSYHAHHGIHHIQQ